MEKEEENGTLPPAVGIERQDIHEDSYLHRIKG